jgi:predicted small lipoprotein YifL
MKNLLSLLVVAALVVSSIGCGSPAPTTGSSKPVTKSETKAGTMTETTKETTKPDTK